MSRHHRYLASLLLTVLVSVATLTVAYTCTETHTVRMRTVAHVHTKEVL